MSFFESIKSAIYGSYIADEMFYEAVAQEVLSGDIRPGLWVKCLADTGYNESKAKARYINLRVEILKREVIELRRAYEIQGRSRQQLIENEQRQIELDAVPAYERRDYDRAFQGFTLLAEKGQAWAQNYLGWMIEHGQGVTRDVYAAIPWYEKSAEQNNKDAQFNLGRIYLHEIKIYCVAVDWLEKAERNGHLRVGNMKKLALELLQAQKRLRR
jgi:TPR repeat protein